MTRDYPQDDEELLQAVNRGLFYLEHIPHCSFGEKDMDVAWEHALYFMTRNAKRRFR